MDIWLIRHGETLWNREKRFQGHQDIALSDAGRDQARACGQQLQGVPFSALYSSDLRRAAETAELIFEGRDLAPVFDERFRERHMGVLQGHTRDEIPEKFPEAWSAFNENQPDREVDGGGESIRMVRDRVFDAFNELAQRHLGERIAVVSHGGVARVCVRHVLGISDLIPSRFPVPNLAIQVMTFDPKLETDGMPQNAWRLKSLNLFTET